MSAVAFYKGEKDMRHDIKTYQEICPVLDKLFKQHGKKTATAINRYLRIRTETNQTERRIDELETELRDLKKVDSLARRRKAK